jgi:hypothetical protein
VTGGGLSMSIENREYKQVKISVDSAIASAFKETCGIKGTSMAVELSKFMADFSKTTTVREKTADYSTRRQRRTAIQTIVKQLEQIRDGEERYRDNIPGNLQGSMVYDKANELVSLLDEVIDLMVEF